MWLRLWLGNRLRSVKASDQLVGLDRAPLMVGDKMNAHRIRHAQLAPA
jgi:hypothetical protein